MKKLVLACAAVIALACTWWGVRAALPGRPVTSGEAQAHVLARVPAQEPLRAPEAAAPREPLPEIAPAVAAATGDLVVRALWAADGSPIADLCVDVACFQDPGPRRRWLHGLTDADGLARFEGLPPGRVRLFAPQGEAGDAQIVAGSTARARLELAASLGVRGRVVDPRGAPVGNAEVWVHMGFVESAHVLARSRPDGRFEIWGLAGRAKLGARAAGWQPSLMFEAAELPPGPGGSREVTLELGEPGNALSGRVLSPEGEPVVDARVLVGGIPDLSGAVVDQADGKRGYSPLRAPLRTDTEGAFQHPGDLAAGDYQVHVCAHGHPAWSGNVRVLQGAPTRLEVRLEHAVQVAGRVVDASGTPIAGAEVRATRDAWREERSDLPFSAPRTKTDEQGLFLLDWITPGTQVLNARVPGQDRRGQARATLSCVAGERREVELVLELGLTIRGRVVDAHGRPLVGWTVRGASTGFLADRASGWMRGLGLQRSDSTREDGSFLLADLYSGELLDDRGMDLQVMAPGEFVTRAEARGVRPGAEAVELVVEKARSRPSWLRGQLLDGLGGVPQDVQVTVWDVSDTAGFFASYDLATGAFQHELAIPGRYDVRVMRGGNTLLASGPHDLAAGQVLDIGKLTLGSPGQVELRVRGVSAAEREHARFVLGSARAADEQLHSEGDWLRSRPLAPGSWSLQVHSERWFAPDQEVVVREGETTRVEIELVPALPVELAFTLPGPEASWGSVAVEIRDAAGEPVRRYGPWTPARLGAGPLKLHGLALPPGTYTAVARTDGGQQATGTLAITDVLSARGPHRFELR